MHLGKVEPGMIPWNSYNWYYPYPVETRNYYNSATYYIAVRKWTDHYYHLKWLRGF